MEIRYLEDWEKQNSRDLWEKAFPEDSQPFKDYYFQEKTRDNRILVKEEKGEILSMIHLNPYQIKVKEREYVLDYIVGVATKEDRRHEGHMRDLLRRMMADMEKERVPFTFLMPASESIYYPFDFRFIFDQPKEALESGQYRETWMEAGTMTSQEAAETAAWMEQWLKERYQVYGVRTTEYVSRLDQELASEKGRWFWLYQDNVPVGIRCEWGLGNREQRLLYLNREVDIAGKTKADHPAIMARIICLKEFLKNICLKEEDPEESLEVVMKIQDPLISENQGLWKWTLDKKGSAAEKLLSKEEQKVLKKEPESKESSFQTEGEETAVSLTIGEVTQWLFGYKTMEKRKWMKRIQPLAGVFLDEVV